MELGKGQEGQWERRIERVMDSVLVSLILCTVPKLVAMIVPIGSSCKGWDGSKAVLRFSEYSS